MRSWIHAAGVRAIKTMAQAAVAMIGTSVVVSDVDWRIVLSASILAGGLSLLTSLAGLPEVDDTKIYDRDEEEGEPEDEDSEGGPVG